MCTNVSWLIYLMSVHTHKKRMMFASMLWFLNNKPFCFIDIVHNDWPMSISSLCYAMKSQFAHPHVIPNQSEFLCSVEHGKKINFFWRTVLLICCIQWKHKVSSYWINLKLSLVLMIKKIHLNMCKNKKFCLI